MRLLLPIILVVITAPATFGNSFIKGSDISAQSVLEQMNFYRAVQGLPPLTLDPRLMIAADDRMRKMEEEKYWAHQSPEGVGPFAGLVTRGYDHSHAGENLANGFETAEVLVTAWMESPGHRANILNDNFVHAGIAIIEGSTLGRMTGKSVVVLFAREKLRTVPYARKQ